MDGTQSFSHERISHNVSADIAALQAQLDQYRRKTEHLARLNELHHRLAGATDLTSVTEAFSVWLMPHVDHSLLAYQDKSLERLCLSCSSHGPDRRLETEAAKELLAWPLKEGNQAWHQKGNYFFHSWQLEAGSEKRRLLLIRKGLPFNLEEIQLVNEVLPVLRDPLQRAVTYEDLYEQARRDSLTGLANRRVFEENISKILESAKRHSTPLTLASMDLDNFKQVNDTLGHAMGDTVLQQVSTILSSLVRGCDLLVRMGGDEFILVLPNTNCAAAQKLADRLRLAVREMALSQGGCENLALSVGLAEWSPDLSQEEWLQMADDNLYEAKAMSGFRLSAGAA